MSCSFTLSQPAATPVGNNRDANDPSLQPIATPFAAHRRNQPTMIVTVPGHARSYSSRWKIGAAFVGSALGAYVSNQAC
jgi:hypothetical protein